MTQLNSLKNNALTAFQNAIQSYKEYITEGLRLAYTDCGISINKPNVQVTHTGLVDTFELLPFDKQVACNLEDMLASDRNRFSETFYLYGKKVSATGRKSNKVIKIPALFTFITGQGTIEFYNKNCLIID